MANDKTYVTETSFADVKKYKERLYKFFKENEEYHLKNNIYISEMYRNPGKYIEIEANFPDNSEEYYLCLVRMDKAFSKFIEVEIDKKCKMDSEFISLEKEKLDIESKMYNIRNKYGIELINKYKPKQQIEEESSTVS